VVKKFGLSMEDRDRREPRSIFAGPGARKSPTGIGRAKEEEEEGDGQRRGEERREESERHRREKRKKGEEEDAYKKKILKHGTYLENSWTSIKGIQIFGSPISKRGRSENKAFQVSKEETMAFLGNFILKCDFFPPFPFRDQPFFLICIFSLPLSVPVPFLVRGSS
jgi:hypothetical protein